MLNIYQFEQQIETQMKAGHVPGLAIAIVQDQEVIFARGFGVTSVEDGGLPVTPQTLFRIGSTNKPMTGTAIMRLVEDGKLDLDRPVKDYINWFTLSEKGAAERVTLRMLLSHTAGLPTRYQPFGSRSPAPEALEAHVREEVPLYPLVAPPGKLWSYSNPGINVAGYVAQMVSGMPYTTLMQELVFGPLEMKRTTFDPLVAMTYPLAQSHNRKPDGTLSVEHLFAENTANYPSGYIMSTVLDLANFAIMHMNEGRFSERQVLSPESVTQMHTPQADLYTVWDRGYGLTFDIRFYKGLRLVGHDGDVNTFACKFVMAPDAKVAIIILVNRFGIELDKLAYQVLDQLLDLPAEAPQPQTIEPERSLWPLYIGTYQGPFGLATISLESNQLIMNFNGEKLPLKTSKKDLYYYQKLGSEKIASVGFLPEETGPTQYILIDSFYCKRIDRETLSPPDPATWPAYVGTYSDFDTLNIQVKDNQLYLHSQENGVEFSCKPLDRTRFICEVGVVEFRIAENDTVDLLVLREAFTFKRVEKGR